MKTLTYLSLPSCPSQFINALSCALLISSFTPSSSTCILFHAFYYLLAPSATPSLLSWLNIHTFCYYLKVSFMSPPQSSSIIFSSSSASSFIVYAFFSISIHGLHLLIWHSWFIIHVFWSVTSAYCSCHLVDHYLPTLAFTSSSLPLLISLFIPPSSFLHD